MQIGDEMVQQLTSLNPLVTDVAKLDNMYHLANTKVKKQFATNLESGSVICKK